MKSRRHAKILELIAEKPIDTQEELLRQLNLVGFTVTQATVSRDIKELRLVKKLASNGQYRYATAYNDDKFNISFKFHNIFTESVNQIDYVQNLIVLKCFVGMGNAACAALDSMEWQGVVGTVAGDDTVLIIMRNEKAAIDMVAQLKKLLGM